jgi:hypothetical protein
MPPWPRRRHRSPRGRQDSRSWLPKLAFSLWGVPILPAQIEVGFPGRQGAMVHRSLGFGVAAPTEPKSQSDEMTELSEIGPLDRPRRGVSIGALLIWIMVAGASGAVAWDIYGNELRSKLGVVREDASRISASESTPETPANGEIVVLVKDLQTAQKRTEDQLETALQLLTSEQAASKTMADALAALSAKVDALQHPAAVPAAKRPAPVAAVAPPRRPPPAAPRPLAPNPPPEPDQPEPAPGAPAGNRP